MTDEVEEVKEEIKEEEKIEPLFRFRVAGVYTMLLGFLTLFGFFISLFVFDDDYFGGAVDMPVVSIFIALALGTAGWWLFNQRRFSRLVFFVIAPWGAVSLASAFPHSLWPDDLPYTVLLALVFAPLAFLLTRPGTLNALGIKNDRWWRRGGAFLLACVVVMIACRLNVVFARPSSGGGLYGALANANTYVQKLVLCDVPMWHYVLALVLVSIPVRFKKKNKSQMDVDENEQWLDEDS